MTDAPFTPQTPDAHAPARTGSQPPAVPAPAAGGLAKHTWTVELPAGLPLLNANKRQHHMVKARLTKAIREAARVCANRDSVSNLRRAHIVVEYRPPDRRRRDVHNLFPSAKAAVDGLVDAGVLPDDSDEYLTGPDMRLGTPLEKGPLGELRRNGQLVLHITELEVTAP